MEKEYTIKFYEQRNGQKPCELPVLETYAYSNKDAYKAGRDKLEGMAIHYINSCSAYDDDSRLVDAKENLKSLKNGSINTYYEDVYTYSFKVFAKKIFY